MATKLLVPLLGLLVSVVIRQTSAGLTFSMLRDDRCFNYIPDYYLGNVFLPGIRSCAIYCASTDSCAMFMYTVENSSCSLYKGIVPSTYMSLTFSAPGQCKIGDVYQQAGYAIFTSSTNWTVPAGFSSFSGLCIGGGGGGGGGGGITINSTAYGGGGSGLIDYNIVDNLEAGQVISITIGAGGTAGTSGSPSTIGSYINATGGSTSTSGRIGGSGGSGGGFGSVNSNQGSVAGGTGGSDSSGNADSGQGASVWSTAISAITITPLSITYGSGGKANNAGYNGVLAGGGGGGGILINGYGPQAGNGSSIKIGFGGYGYGAGGGGGGCNSTSCYFNGGTGAPGACVIIWGVKL